MRYVSILLISLLSLMLGLGCATQVGSFQEGDLKVRYNGLHCFNDERAHGSIAAKVREKMIFPGVMQILSTNIGPAGRANGLPKGSSRFTPSYSGFGAFSFEDFQAALDEGAAFPVHRVQMELAAKSKSGNITGMTVYAFIEHQTCAELWMALVGPERSDGTIAAWWLWTKDEGWQRQHATFFDKPY